MKRTAAFTLILAMTMVWCVVFSVQAQQSMPYLRADVLPTGDKDVVLQVYVVNEGQPVSLTFNSGYWYDVEVRGPSFYYKDSQGKAYIQMIVKKTFAKGNTHVATLGFTGLKDGTYTFKAWLVNQNVTTTGTFTVGSVREPKDIANSWAKPYIWAMLQKRLLACSGDSFGPNLPMSRGEFLVALAKAMNLQPASLETLGKNPFKDVDVNNSAAGYFWSLYEQQVVNGYPDGTLKPYGFLTRAEAAKVLAVAVSGTTTFEETASQMKQPPFYWVFKDTSGHWAEKYISYVWRNGLMIGYPDQTFKPDALLTKEQGAVILDRVLNTNPAR